MNDVSVRVRGVLLLIVIVVAVVRSRQGGPMHNDIDEPASNKMVAPLAAAHAGGTERATMLPAHRTTLLPNSSVSGK